MARTTDPQKEQFWKAHIAQAKYFNGSINQYCESEGIQVHSFKYWKTRLAKKSASRLPVPSAFIPVNISKPDSQSTKKSLPEPKWVAELILHLHEGLQ